MFIQGVENVYDLDWNSNTNTTGGTTFGVKSISSNYGQQWWGASISISYAANYGAPFFMNVSNAFLSSINILVNRWW